MEKNTCLDDYLVVSNKHCPEMETKILHKKHLYIEENLSEINDIVELPEGIFFV